MNGIVRLVYPFYIYWASPVDLLVIFPVIRSIPRTVLMKLQQNNRRETHWLNTPSCFQMTMYLFFMTTMPSELENSLSQVIYLATKLGVASEDWRHDLQLFNLTEDFICMWQENILYTLFLNLVQYYNSKEVYPFNSQHEHLFHRANEDHQDSDLWAKRPIVKVNVSLSVLKTRADRSINLPASHFQLPSN